MRQFEVQKKKRSTPGDDNDDTNLPDLEPMGGSLDDDIDEEEIDVDEMPDLVDFDADEDADIDEDDEIENVFKDMSQEEKVRWAANVKPVRTAIHKVSNFRIPRRRIQLLTLYPGASHQFQDH